MNRPDITTSTELLDVLAVGRAARDEEDLDLLAHSLQCAQLLAERAPDDAELQIAGLVHDVGTLLEPNRPSTHSATGAVAVAPLLGTRVAALVRGHDTAKRYLVVADAAYRARLTPRSIETMAAQGGPLGDDERAAFESDPEFDSLVTLRRADDDAKDPARDVPPLEAWRSLLEKVAAQHGE